jgi:hypothetical protein
MEKWAAKVGAGLRPARAISVSFKAGALLAGAAWVVDGRLVVSGGVLSGFVLGADRRARFVLVVSMQVVALIGAGG